MKKWTLEDAFRLIRALQPEIRQFGYHLCMGGSVLNFGESTKDLDLYFLPLDNGGPIEESKLIAHLLFLWGNYEDLKKTGYYSASPVSAYKHKLKFMMAGTDRIDVFIL